jgi:dTMP kinase
MFIVFEGIDGSGKTTVSNRVAKLLRDRGVSVEHVREGGVFSSPVAQNIRDFAKSTRNLALDPHAELLLQLARETQALEECVRPAMARGSVVFADRYLYSAQVLARHGRELPDAEVDPVVQSAARGVWPELVVLLDADPHTARIRRRVRKLGRPKKTGAVSGKSRKNLAGIGLARRMAAGYRELAAADPERWLVIRSTDPNNPLDKVVAAVTDAISTLLEKGDSGTAVRAGAVHFEKAATAPPSPASMGLDEVPEYFYRQVQQRVSTEPGVAAYLIAGLSHDAAFEVRGSLVDKVPGVVARGLKGIDDDRAWALRERLLDVVPGDVVRSLDDRIDQGRAASMRHRLAPIAPIDVLSSLAGIDSRQSWVLRTELCGAYPAETVASLRGIGSENAWRMRANLMETIALNRVLNLRNTVALLASLRGLDDFRAWSVRKQHFDEAPVVTLASINGIKSDAAWELRQQWARHALKVVLRTFDGSADDRAWSLRDEFGRAAKEALDSLAGLDDDRAWDFRREHAEQWASTAVKSALKTSSRDRGLALAERLLRRAPSDLSLLKHVTRLVTGEDSGGDVDIE